MQIILNFLFGYFIWIDDSYHLSRHEEFIIFMLYILIKSSIGSTFTYKVRKDQNVTNRYTQSDLMTAVTDATTELTPVLKFNHRLSNIVINLTFEQAISFGYPVDNHHAVSDRFELSNTFVCSNIVDMFVNFVRTIRWWGSRTPPRWPLRTPGDTFTCRQLRAVRLGPCRG